MELPVNNKQELQQGSIPLFSSECMDITSREVKVAHRIYL